MSSASSIDEGAFRLVIMNSFHWVANIVACFSTRHNLPEKKDARNFSPEKLCPGRRTPIIDSNTMRKPHASRVPAPGQKMVFQQEWFNLAFFRFLGPA